MALMGCVGSRALDTLLQAMEEAVKENSDSRLSILLSDGRVGAQAINHRHLLHQAAWLGFPRCVRLLLEQGADPDKCHRKNGCTPLHLAHFCTIEESNPGQTIRELLAAGASVNNAGSRKCGKCPVDHAIWQQRLDSVEVLLAAGAAASLNSVQIAVDVANPQILELLLLNGAQCGKLSEGVLFWGEAMHRVLYTPLKCPKECYKQMFRLTAQGTVCRPLRGVTIDSDREPSNKKSSNHHLLVETELRTLAKHYVDLTVYLFAFMVRNGFHPNEAIKTYIKDLTPVEWLDPYLASPPTLRDLAVRTVRSHGYVSGNILYAVERLQLPTRMKHMILMNNPL